MIEVLGSSSCVPCQQSKELFKNNSVDFKYYDIADTSEQVKNLKLQMMANGVRSVPAFFKDGKYFGFGLETAKIICEE